MTIAATIVFCIILGAVFAKWVPLAHLFDAFQPMMVALSIMVAAVLVRLNRGMPAIDWKTLEQPARVDLTSRMVALTREYVAIVTVNGALLIGLVCLTTAGRDLVVGKAPSSVGLPAAVQQGIAAAIGALTALAIARMAYVVWRDYDVVRLQKAVIDAAGERDEAERQSKIAAERIAGIRGANLRSVSGGEPKAWEG